MYGLDDGSMIGKRLGERAIRRTEPRGLRLGDEANFLLVTKAVSTLHRLPWLGKMQIDPPPFILGDQNQYLSTLMTTIRYASTPGG